GSTTETSAENFDLAVACAVVAALAVSLTNTHSKRESVTLAFVGHTNIVVRGIWGDYELAKLCIFRGTNGTSRAIGYYAMMEYPPCARALRLLAPAPFLQTRQPTCPQANP